MSRPAARLGDPTAHGGKITSGAQKVLIQGAPAARIGDAHVCPQSTGTTAHVGGPIQSGSATVFIEGKAAARVGDTAFCAAGPLDVIVAGCPTVLIGD